MEPSEASPSGSPEGSEADLSDEEMCLVSSDDDSSGSDDEDAMDVGADGVTNIEWGEWEEEDYEEEKRSKAQPQARRVQLAGRHQLRRRVR